MADSFKVIIAALCITVACHLVQMYPTGAPEEACDTMRPGHHTIKYNNSSPLHEPTTDIEFYDFHFNRTLVRPGESVQVMIQTVNPFQGFLIQVRDVIPKISDNNKVIKYGTFTSVNSSETKSVCGNQGITHVQAKNNTELTFTWTAPNEEHENLHFIEFMESNFHKYISTFENCYCPFHKYQHYYEFVNDNLYWKRINDLEIDGEVVYSPYIEICPKHPNKTI